LLYNGKLHCPLTILAAFLLMLTLAMPTLAAADEVEAPDSSDDDDQPDEGADDRDDRDDEDDNVLPDIDVSGESEDDEDDGTIAAGDTVVVTGTRTKRQASDAPVATSVVTQQQVENSGAVDAGDALETVPGVFVDDYETAGRGGPGSGVNLQGLPTDRILVLIDGQRMPWTMRAPDLELIPAELIRRIEVVKGPSSSLYGSDAVGGVINILTREPSADPTAELSLAGGSFNTYKGNAFHAWSAGGAGWVLNFNREQSDGWIDANASRAVVTMGEGVTDTLAVPYDDGHPYETNDLFGKLRLQVNPHLSLRTQARYHWEDNQFSDADDGAVSDNKTQLSGLAEATLELGPFSATLTGGHFRRYFRYREFSTAYVVNPLPPPDLLRSYVDKGNTTIGDESNGELLLSWALADWNMLTAGAHLRYETLDYSAFEHSAMTDDEQGYDAYQTIWSGFVQDEIFLFANVWSLVPGVRVDYHDAWGAVVNPKLSTLVKASASTALRASVGRAFREPTLSQLYRPIFRHSGYFMIGNEDLEPEEVLGWNAEIEQVFGSVVKATAGYFQYELYDMIWQEIIDSDYQSGLALMTYTNLKRARIYGGEGALNVTPWRYAGLNLNYTYTKTLDLDEDTALGTVPEHNAGGQLFVDYRPWGLGGFVGATFQTERDYIGMGGQWYTADPRWSTTGRVYKTLGDHVELGLRVFNWLGYSWDREGDGDNDLQPTSYYGELKLSL